MGDSDSPGKFHMILFSLTKESVSIPSTGRDHAHGDCLRLYSRNGLRFSCSELEIEDENKQTNLLPSTQTFVLHWTLIGRVSQKSIYYIFDFGYQSIGKGNTRVRGLDAFKEKTIPRGLDAFKENYSYLVGQSIQRKTWIEAVLTLVTLCQLISLLFFSWNSWCICSLLDNCFPYIAYFRTASKASSLVDYFILLPKIELELVMMLLTLSLK